MLSIYTILNDLQKIEKYRFWTYSVDMTPCSKRWSRMTLLSPAIFPMQSIHSSTLILFGDVGAAWRLVVCRSDIKYGPTPLLSTDNSNCIRVGLEPGVTLSMTSVQLLDDDGSPFEEEGEDGSTLVNRCRTSFDKLMFLSEKKDDNSTVTDDPVDDCPPPFAPPKFRRFQRPADRLVFRIWRVVSFRRLLVPSELIPGLWLLRSFLVFGCDILCGYVVTWCGVWYYKIMVFWHETWIGWLSCEESEGMICCLP